jgi:hypothetical protein
MLINHPMCVDAPIVYHARTLHYKGLLLKGWGKIPPHFFLSQIAAFQKSNLVGWIIYLVVEWPKDVEELNTFKSHASFVILLLVLIKLPPLREEAFNISLMITIESPMTISFLICFSPTILNP